MTEEVREGCRKALETKGTQNISGRSQREEHRRDMITGEGGRRDGELGGNKRSLLAALLSEGSLQPRL